jgi:hypothetical protein
VAAMELVAASRRSAKSCVSRLSSVVLVVGGGDLVSSQLYYAGRGPCRHNCAIYCGNVHHIVGRSEHARSMSCGRQPLSSRSKLCIDNVR